MLSFWPHIPFAHIASAVAGGILGYPFKAAWDWWIETFWIGFKLGIKESEGGRRLIAAFNQGKAEAEARTLAKHPELKSALDEIHAKEAQ
jgi:hypothetical protein